MKAIFDLHQRDLSDLIRQTANRMGVAPVVVEKDVWVCAVLDKLFDSAVYRDRFVFKGGTSLSKAFGIIKRFSEDVDLIMDWRLLGYGPPGDDPSKAQLSRTQQAKLSQTISAECHAYLYAAFAPWLRDQMLALTNRPIEVEVTGEQAVSVRYPALFGSDYVSSQVLLEIGPLAAWVPSSWSTLSPFVAAEYPNVVGPLEFDVRVTAPERTFWEKVTILHQQAHSSHPLQARYARHYYDVVMLKRAGVADRALSNPALLRDVVEFKERFYWSASARYDLATRGGMRLVPDAPRLRQLARDYADMGVMFFRDPPPWDVVVHELRLLELQINERPLV